MSDDYKGYVEHPRYGRAPRITGFNPISTIEKYQHLSIDELINQENSFGEEDFVTIHARKKSRIPNTAIVADESKQLNATYPATYYFDVKRTCLDCKKPFIFFAQEQKYWYEELGFNLSADSVRCFFCRKQKRKIENNLSKLKMRYEELFHTKNRTRYETLEMAEYCLSLIELNEFSMRKIDKVRMLLNQLSNENDEKVRANIEKLRKCLIKLESNFKIPVN